MKEQGDYKPGHQLDILETQDGGMQDLVVECTLGEDGTVTFKGNEGLIENLTKGIADPEDPSKVITPDSGRAFLAALRHSGDYNSSYMSVVERPEDET